MHAIVAHRDTVADSDGVELEWRAAGHQDTILDRTGDLLQVLMTRNDLGE